MRHGRRSTTKRPFVGRAVREGVPDRPHQGAQNVAGLGHKVQSDVREATQLTQLNLNLDELRYWLIKQALIQPLQSPPGVIYRLAQNNNWVGSYESGSAPAQVISFPKQ